MSRTTPEETFAEARTAMEGGDWEGFFACVDDDTLLRSAENGVARFLIGGRDDTADTTADTFTTLCQDQAVPQDMVLGLRTRLQRISKSARASIASASDPTAMVQQSLRHKQVVDEYRKALRNMLKAVWELSSFTVALERAMRAGGASGSVSSRLFEEVSITGTKACATRRLAEGPSEDVGFVRRKGGLVHPTPGEATGAIATLSGPRRASGCRRALGA